MRGAFARRALSQLVVFLGIVHLRVETARAEQFDIISVTRSGAKTQYLIQRPNVRQRQTQYTSIRFKAGDRVNIEAGGCAQTGGSGKTWKRYVDPQGGNAQKYYAGTIAITGVTTPGQMDRIARWLNRWLSIPRGATPTLTLGYEDDDYSDNGYWGQDDGTGNQCKNVGPAWVRITVDPTATPTPAPAGKPMDLVWDAVDDNGLPLNPRWRGQGSTSGSLNVKSACGLSNPQDEAAVRTSCTSQPTSVDGAWLTCDPDNTHVNWFPVTYVGRVDWKDHGKDDDYNFLLYPPNGAGTINGFQYMFAEFDSDETIDNFKSAWWNAFHSAVDRSDQAAAAMVSGKQAIVIGLLGIDFEHDVWTESHPVYALALHVQDNPSDDRWAIFVRNWGNEGWCSKDQHYLDLTQITLRLPRPGATGVTETFADFRTNSRATAMSNVTLAPGGGGALVTFTLPRPEAKAHVDGELRLRWSVPRMGPGATMASKTVNAATPLRLGRLSSAATTKNGEAVYEGAIRTLSHEGLTRMRAMLHTERRAGSSAALRRGGGTTLGVATTRGGVPLRARSVYDGGKVERDQRRLKALCDSALGQRGRPLVCNRLTGAGPRRNQPSRVPR